MRVIQFALASTAMLGLTATGSRAADQRDGASVAHTPVTIERRNDDTDEPLPDDRPPRGTIDPVTITGRLFYNDRRNEGHFDQRRTPSGQPGTRCGRTGTCGPNFLAAHKMTVEAIEIDRPRAGSTPFCRPMTLLASAVVDERGFYRLSFEHRDRCGDNSRGEMSIHVRFRSRFCDAILCYSIGPEGTNGYIVGHLDATQGRPKIVRAGQRLRLPDAAFNGLGDVNVANVTSIAANYFASIVDTMTFVHEQNSVPFYNAQYGELSYRYPSEDTGSATAFSPTDIAISHYNGNSLTVTGPGQIKSIVPAWPDAKAVAHEYGHVLMQRAWNGSYGANLVGRSAGDGARADEPANQRAFKEAWAEFTSHAVFDAQYSCEAAETDDNSAAPPGTAFGPASDGTAYRFNVRKMLCDWYDDRSDDDLALPGAGDRFAATNFRSMWFNIRRMYVDRDRYGGQYQDPGLMACDWVNYYRIVRRPENRARIDDLIANNNITCAIPPPLVTRVAPLADTPSRTSPRVPMPTEPPISGD